MLIDRVHFSRETTSPEDAGWRAAAANLSDLAAMGATPLGITVGLGLPSNITVNWVERLYQGMTECLQKFSTPIVGGDIVRSPVITLAITAFGQADPSFIIRRATAQVGDAIVVTGYHGASRAGLELLLDPESGQQLNVAEKSALIQAHQRPNPRLDVLPILEEILAAADFPVLTGMDSSDGLADAVVQICRSSHLGAVLEYRKIPLPSVFPYWLSGDKTREYVLYGGEDFELVLCLPQELASILVERLGKDAAIIGTILQEPKVILHDEQGTFPDLLLHLNHGFQHFSH
jgi:thiamine-monophosphate kinase